MQKMLLHIFFILLYSAFVILPYVVGRFGAKDTAKKTTKKLSIGQQIGIYGQSLFVPFLIFAFMGSGGSDELQIDNPKEPDIVEMWSAFIVASVSAFVACFYEIYKHNSRVNEKG